MKFAAELCWALLDLGADAASMAYNNPWRLSSLLSAVSELLVAFLLLIQIGLAFLILQLIKRFSIGSACVHSDRRHHAFFRFGPFSLSGDFLLSYPQEEKKRAIAKSIANPSITEGLHAGNIHVGEGDVDQSGQQTGGVGCSNLYCGSQTCDNVTDGNNFSGLRTGLPCLGTSAGSSLVYRRRGNGRSASKSNSSSSIEALKLKNNEEVVDDDADSSALSLLNHSYSLGWGCAGLTNRQLQQFLSAKPEQEFSLLDGEVSLFNEGGQCGNDAVIQSLLKLLRAEQQNLHNIYAELEEERIAAETAANEAMAMILRLQEEKSALQLEAAHYQRMVEEKSIHDEQAIQLLEEDLCRKENERLMLEEELNHFRKHRSGDGNVNVERYSEEQHMEDHLLYLEGREPVLFIAGNNDTEELDKENYSEVIERKQSDEPSQMIEIFKYTESTYAVEDVDCSTVTFSGEEVISSTTDDASSILDQLSALEKQLQGLGEPTEPDSWNHVSEKGLSKDNTDSSIFSADVYDDDVAIQKSTECDISNCTESTIDEEKVVNIDVANMSSEASWETKVTNAESIFENTRHTNQVHKQDQLNDAHEDEKHLDLPSFVPAPTPETPRLKDTLKSYSIDSSLRSEKMLDNSKWYSGSVTLEEIDKRLKILENESMLLRSQSIPSDGEHMNLALLKEIIQELQGLLHPNKNASGHDPSPLMDVQLKGENTRKRHFSDGPGMTH